MRLLITVLATALALTGAQAQQPMSPQAAQIQGAQNLGAHASQNGHADDGSAKLKAKANDKAYDAALKNLPDKQYDPWHGVR